MPPIEMEQVHDDISHNEMAATDPISPALPHADGREGLLSASFMGLLITQFLGALNDNLFRWLVAWIGGDLASDDRVFRWFVGLLGKQLSPEGYKEIAVQIGLAMLVAPFILLAVPAGYFADRFSKRNVIISCKVAEVILMLLGALVIYNGSVWLMFLTLFLMGSHSAIFGPSKYGSIPEIVRPECIPAANGLIGMTTIVAIVGGTVGAGFLYEFTKPLGMHHGWLWASTIIGVAMLGCMTSLPIRRLKVANPTRPFHLNFAVETFRDIRQLMAVRTLFLVAVASAIFWSLGGLCQINVNGFGDVHLKLAKDTIGPLLGIMAVGVGIGCIFAGWISHGKIKMALVPLGAAGIALSHILLYFVPEGNGLASSFGYIMTGCCLMLLGFSGGLYDVPLQSYLQHHSPEKTRGSIFAATNLLTFSGTLLATGIFFLMRSVLGLHNQTIFLIVGLALLPFVVVLIRFTAFDTTRSIVLMISKIMYRVKIEGLENVPETGVIITPNHVSWVDGVLVGLATPRHPRMVVFADYFEKPWIKWFGQLGRVIPIHPGKRSIIESLRTAREALNNGEIVCVFPEGGITRTGAIREFQPGVLTILKGTNAPVVPVYIDGLWGSIFSFKGGKFFWKIPRKLRPRVTIRFGKPIENPKDLEEVRNAVIALGGGKEEY
jgi:acyl-[acyl-carrier-protein]-phospholipid O-acyltransferase/long-chain-fatty-acid--[acyl-carrier-protein] ligase